MIGWPDTCKKCPEFCDLRCGRLFALFGRSLGKRIAALVPNLILAVLHGTGGIIRKGSDMPVVLAGDK
jgi:hypothetical protein